MIVREERQSRVAFLLDDLTGGGAERSTLNTALGFARSGHHVDLLVLRPEGAFLDSVPEGVNLVPLQLSSRLRGLLSALWADPAAGREILRSVERGRSRLRVPKSFRYIPAVAKYLRENEVDVLLAVLPDSCISAALAGASSGTSTRLVTGIQTNASAQFADFHRRGEDRLPRLLPLLRRYYRRMDAIVAVSDGVKRDALDFFGLEAERVFTVYNATDFGEVEALGDEPVEHPWFEAGASPVLLGIGRFAAQKNFPLLLRAFAAVRERREARLVLLGGTESVAAEREHRRELEALAESLGVAGDVDMPGFQSNPFAYLTKASAFVLSSNFEGLGGVLVEALAAGCPVVSTDCPSGPAEILGNGKYGRLVALDDPDALADAICETLDAPRDEDLLRARADAFSIERTVAGYARVFFGDEIDSRQATGSAVQAHLPAVPPPAIRR